jgi:hypothetical protein
MSARRRVYHIYKKTYADKQQHYLGSTKDIRSREEYFRTRGFDYLPILTDPQDKHYRSLTRISRREWRQCSVVLVEMTFSPGALLIIRRLAPDATILVRSHNAELLHRFDWACAQGFTAGGVRSLIHAIKNSCLDHLSGQRTDFVLCISDWEARQYWPLLAKQDKIKYVPFFLTQTYIEELKAPCVKKMHCIHFGASLPNPLIADATQKFIRAVNCLPDAWDQWKFFVTGTHSKAILQQSNRINWTGFLNRPYDILRECKAMALLSEYGYGFKTKILEAIMAETFVILPLKLFSRLPNVIKPFCIKFDPESEHSFQNALNEAEREFPPGNLNDLLRHQAFRTLDEIIAIHNFSPPN